MLGNTRKRRKVSFSEDDAATLIHRYEASTVLTLLQEVARYPDVKIDWNELVKKTSTGISNAREYQMLWRHLAYRDELTENLEDGADPLDDDSDLECELEALPPITGESVSEAAACVKVMITSGTFNGPTTSATIEAPLTISVPTSFSSGTKENSQPLSSMMQGKSIIFPVTVLRQTAANVSSTEVVEANGLASGNMNSKRKRNAWSEEDDKLLRAAVERHGEGNWATISKEYNFSVKRSSLQLAQRWTALRKKEGNTNSVTNPPSSQFTAEQLATRHSLSLALDMPFKKLAAAGTTDPARTPLNASAKNHVQPNNAAEALKTRGNSVSAQHPSQQALPGPSYSAKCKVVSEKIMPKSNLSPDSAVRAAAVAAGARVVSSSNTVSQLKAAQARNTVHIMPPCTSQMKLSIPPVSSSHPKAHSAVSLSSAFAVSSPASRTSAVKAASPKVESHPPTMSNVLSQQRNRISSVKNEAPLRQEVNSNLVSSVATEVSLRQEDVSTNLVSFVANEVPIKQEVNPKLTNSAVSEVSLKQVNPNHISPLANEVPSDQEANPNLVSPVANEVPSKQAANHKPVSSVANEVVPVKQEVNPNVVISVASKVPFKQEVDPNLVSSGIDEVPSKQEVNPNLVSSVANKVPFEQEVNPNNVNSVANEVLLKKEVNPTEASSLVPKERIEDNTATIVERPPREEIQEEIAPSQNPGESKIQGAGVKNLNFTSNMDTAENHHVAVDGNLSKERQDSNHTKSMDQWVKNEGRYHPADNGSSQAQSLKDKQASLQSVVQDECSRASKS